MRKNMEKYYGKPSEVGKNIKKAAKKVVSDAKSSPQAKAVAKAVKSPSVQTAAGLLIPGGAALKAPKVMKGVKAAAKAVGKAVGIGKPKSLAKSYDPTIPFKPDYKPPKTDIAYRQGGKDFLTPGAAQRARAQEANAAYEKMMKQRQANLDAQIKSIRTDPRLSPNQRDSAVDDVMRAYKRENRRTGRE